MRQRGLIPLRAYRRWRRGPRTRPGSCGAPVSATVVSEPEAEALLALGRASARRGVYVQVEWSEP